MKRFNYRLWGLPSIPRPSVCPSLEGPCSLSLLLSLYIHIYLSILRCIHTFVDLAIWNAAAFVSVTARLLLSSVRSKARASLYGSYRRGNTVEPRTHQFERNFVGTCMYIYVCMCVCVYRVTRDLRSNGNASLAPNCPLKVWHLTSQSRKIILHILYTREQYIII